MTGEKLPSVLIVTSEMIGPFKNGGIGTATTGLIETVAGMGCPTKVLYTGAIWHIEIDMKPWIARYAAIGVTLVPLTLVDMRRLAGPLCDEGVGTAYLVYQYLRRHHFDIVHFNDTLGEGMYALAAKRLGIAFGNTRMALALHGPTRWAYRLNRQPMSGLLYAAFDAMERVSIRAADFIWGPSAYLVEDIVNDGWSFPAQPRLQQYVMPTPTLFEPGTAKFAAADAMPAAHTVKPVEEIVFFGRLEQRKGLRTFSDAVERLDARLSAAGVRVTFLGKPVQQDGGYTDGWIRERAAKWQTQWRIESGFGQPEAVAYLKSRACVAIMPSPFDNSPCTIYEAMQFGISFLASATGGIPELIDPADHERVLFSYTVEGIAEAIERVLTDGAGTARPRFAPVERRSAWVEIHHELRVENPAPIASPVPARFAVLVEPDGSSDGLRQTAESVRRVLGDRVAARIVLGPTAAEGFSAIDTAEQLAAALQAAGAAWVLCLKAGTRLVFEALPAVETALAQPEIGGGLIPAARLRGPSGPIVPPMGGAPAFGFFWGYDYTGGAIVAAAEVAAQLRDGGGLGVSLAGLLDRIAVGGSELWPFPEPFFEIAQTPRPAPTDMSPARVAAYALVPPAEAGIIRDIAAMAANGRPKASRVRQILLMLAALPGFTALRPLIAATLPGALKIYGRLRGV